MALQNSDANARQQDRKTLLVAALMCAIALAALDATIVATALPTIVGNLGGLSLFSWVFSIYLLASTVTVPLYGKLADLYGRKPVVLFGCGVFLLGSICCGISQNMEQLIISRAIQGLGAGAVQPVTMTIIGDIFTMEQRAKIQGLFSSVWGFVSLLGPAIGGVIVDGASWRLAFLLNVPLGLLSMVLIWRYFQEKAEKRQSHVIDYWGTVLFSGAVVALLLAVLQAVKSYGWLGTPTLGLFATSAVLMALFVWQESRAREPVLPLWLFRNKVIVVASMCTFLTGGLMFGINSYVPLFAQGVRGGSAMDAGLIVLPLSVTWPLGSMLAGPHHDQARLLRFGELRCRHARHRLATPAAGDHRHLDRPAAGRRRHRRSRHGLHDAVADHLRAELGRMEQPRRGDGDDAVLPHDRRRYLGRRHGRHPQQRACRTTSPACPASRRA